MYERLGLKITKIHRGIKFEERAWLKEYVDLNTELRTKAKNNFEKDFFKLMNNCVFGKTIENIENRVDIKLVTDKNNARKLAAKPNYDHCTIFDENLVAIHMTKTKIYYNKPVYLGMRILDLSKTNTYILKPSASKTISSVFHLHNTSATRELSVYLDGLRLRHECHPTYLTENT